jgi:multidrug efflux pump subunit AcrA (membrane-fusion protein)
MVAEARLIGANQINAITIPGSAIVRDEQGVTQVFIFEPDKNRVYRRRVEVGSMIGHEVEIRSGLNGKEQVVVDGQQNVREGSIVNVEGGLK